MDEDLFTYEVEIAVMANIPCDLNKENDSERLMSHESDNDMEYDPSNVDFTECWRDDGYCNGVNLPGAYIVGNALHYQDFEWYEDLKDWKLKEEALINKAIMEGLIKDEGDELRNKGWRRWNVYEDTNHDHEYEMKHEVEERHELCDDIDQERPVCNIRRFEMIKYSFRDDEKYVAKKEDEYDDLTSTSEDACRAYQEIFCMMDEGWMDLAGKKSTMLVKYLQSGILAQLNLHGESTEQISDEFLILILFKSCF
ncbi:hypothetical protein Tco_1413382 [Tanacetum coccineum]|uniref:Uncharacterized protein n=1 Tax=Tanacetum coccineum TaxID=301880 RepID=A0ABQ5CVA2_9ASTR